MEPLSVHESIKAILDGNVKDYSDESLFNEKTIRRRAIQSTIICDNGLHILRYISTYEFDLKEGVIHTKDDKPLHSIEAYVIVDVFNSTFSYYCFDTLEFCYESVDRGIICNKDEKRFEQIMGKLEMEQYERDGSIAMMLDVLKTAKNIEEV